MRLIGDNFAQIKIQKAMKEFQKLITILDTKHHNTKQDIVNTFRK